VNRATTWITRTLLAIADKTGRKDPLMKDERVYPAGEVLNELLELYREMQLRTVEVQAKAAEARARSGESRRRAGELRLSNSHLRRAGHWSAVKRLTSPPERL
jgi:hypothetical protein